MAESDKEGDVAREGDVVLQAPSGEEASGEVAAAKGESGAVAEQEWLDGYGGAELMVPQVESNSLGVWDGQTFFLRAFPVWYRWRQVRDAIRSKDKPESGEVNGVAWEQTMGRIVMWYNLDNEDFQVEEEDVWVYMSCWQLEVTIGKDVQVQKGSKLVGGRKIVPLCGELHADVRLKFSWWELVNDGCSRWLAIYFTKLEHRGWTGPWYQHCMNPHNKVSFAWNDKLFTIKTEDEKLERKPCGTPKDIEKELICGVQPERLCTGIDVEEDEYFVNVTVHLDEESMEVATGRLPMEELFSADVQSDRLELYLRSDGLGIASGIFKGAVDPTSTTWEVRSVRRRTLPKGTRIKCPAFYNPALCIKIAKACDHQHLWDGGFSELQAVEFELPQERMSWTERVQRALVLAPGAPLKQQVKNANASDMCQRVETSQDTVTQRAIITLHLVGDMEQRFTKYKVDPTSFFSLKVGSQMLEVSIVADCEFTMVVGRLGGNVDQDKTTWEIMQERDTLTSETTHMALKITLAKATGHRDRWPTVFERMEPWEVAKLMRPQLQDQCATDEALLDNGAGDGE